MTVADPQPPQYPTTLLTSFSAASVPGWLKAYSPDVVTPGRLKTHRALPEFTIVRSRTLADLIARKAFLAVLAQRQESTPRPSKILFVFDGGEVTSDELVPLLRWFPRPEDIEFAVGSKAGPAAVEEATAKLAIDRARRARAEPALAAGDSISEVGQLGRAKALIAATAKLRSAETGRLSADRVAELFALSQTALAELLGRSKQAVSKTPDSEAIQASLRPFERAARLLAVLDEGDFRRWLNLGNELLDNASPLELIRQGRVGLVADLAEDMLTGSPT